MRTYTCKICAKTSHSAGMTFSCIHCGGIVLPEHEKFERKVEENLPSLQMLGRRASQVSQV